MSFGTLTAEQAQILQERYRIEKALGKDLDILAKQVGYGCLHDACPNCNGTGVRKDGLGVCFHGISCPCPKCSFTC